MQRIATIAASMLTGVLLLVPGVAAAAPAPPSAAACCSFSHAEVITGSHAPPSHTLFRTTKIAASWSACLSARKARHARVS